MPNTQIGNEPTMPQRPQPSMAGQDLSQLTEEQLMNLPLEDLEALVMDRSSQLAAMGAPMDPLQGQGAMSPSDVPGGGAVPLNPQTVMAATAVLVEAGFLSEATSELSPQVLSALQSFVDKLRPGLYDLSSQQDLS